MGRFIPLAIGYLALNGVAILTGVNVVVLLHANSWTRMFHVAGIGIERMGAQYKTYLYTASLYGHNPFSPHMWMLGLNLEFRLPSRGPSTSAGLVPRNRTAAPPPRDL